MFQRKGVFSFLVITFGITYLVEGIAIALGFRIESIPSAAWQFIVLAMMWVPSLAFVLTRKLVTGESLRHTTGLRLGPWKYYLISWLVVPAPFAVIYCLTWLFGLSHPDWQLTELVNFAISYSTSMDTAPSPLLILVGLLVGLIFAAVWFNSLDAFGEEWGWRDYLAPRLMPLGKWKAYSLMGIIWGLWHADRIPCSELSSSAVSPSTSGYLIMNLASRQRVPYWQHGFMECSTLRRIVSEGICCQSTIRYSVV